MRQYIVDAFSDRIFRGNQAAVCVLEEWPDEPLMMNIARENNFSETAFTVKEGDGYRLRWFTPGGEIDLCGHATLATAFVLFSYYEKDADSITFHYEAAADPGAVIASINEVGKRVGMAIKPQTPVEAVIPFIHRLDMLLIMTVEPGFGGQKYLPKSTRRIQEARRLFQEEGVDIDIEVDGGIKLDNVDSVLDAGANIIVAGSAVYGKDTYGCTKAFLDDFAAWQAKQ